MELKNKSGQSGLIITVAVLLVIGLGLGVLIAKTKLNISPNSVTNQPTSNPNITTKSTPNPQNPTQVIFDAPGPNATTEEKNKYSTIVAQYAVKTDILDVTNCAPEPLVIQIKDKSNISVINESLEEIKLSTDPDHIFTISANQQTTITLDLGHGPGIYAYSCNNGAGPVGIFYLL